MPRNKNIRKVLVIGSGPIVIGQAAEFDYAGAQACRVLQQEGIETILVNSNPATIMTDKSLPTPSIWNLSHRRRSGELSKKNGLTDFWPASAGRRG